MSMPTSIVVVQDRTSMAGCSLLARAGSAEVDVLEQQFVLLGLGEDLVGLGGVELGGVLGAMIAIGVLGRLRSARTVLAR